jgi:hypothetical protein
VPPARTSRQLWRESDFACHSSKEMATYSVTFNQDRSTHDVEIEDDVGGRAVLGFQTKAAALAWIEEDRRINVCVLPDAK